MAARRRAGRRSPDPRPSAPAKSRSGTAFLAAALVAVTVAAYAPVWTFDFVAIDDPQYVSQNPHLTGGLTAANIRWAFTTGREANWHPLTWLSHLVDVELYGLNPGPHHLTNLVLHVINTLLLFGVVRSMTGTVKQSAFVAAIFAVHPLHVESVAWIAERKDVLSALFFLLTLAAYVRYVRSPRIGPYALVLLTFALGLMAKPMLVTLPLLLLLLDWWPMNRFDGHEPRARLRTLIVEKLPLVALAAASSAVTFIVQNRFGAVKSLDTMPFGLRVQNAMVSYVEYLRDVVWPADLGVFYPFPPSVPPVTLIVSVVVLAGVTAGVIRFARRAPYAAVGWLWFVGMLVPVIGLVQVGAQARADRYMYLPLIGLTMTVAWGAASLGRGATSRRLVAGAAVAATAGLAVVTHAQVQHWRDTVALWGHTAEVTNHLPNFGVHFGLAEYLREADRHAEAVASYQEAIRRRPTYAESHYGLGQSLVELRQTDRAILSFAEAVRLRPDYAEARMAMGLLLAQGGRASDAIEQFAEVVRLRPEIAEAHRHLGLALAVSGRIPESLPHFADAVRLDPLSPAARSDYGLALAGSGRHDEAALQYGEALRLDPHFADAHLNLGRLRAVQGRLSEALPHLAEAVRLQPADTDSRFELGVALIRLRRFEEGARELNQVLRLDPSHTRARQALEALTR